MEDNIKKVQKINELRDELEELSSQTRTGFHKIGESDFQKWDYFHRKSALIIKSIFGENSQYSRDWLRIDIPEDPDIDDDKGFSTYLHKQGIAEDKMENQLEIMAKEIVLSTKKKDTKPAAKLKNRNKVFIVHGTDHGPANELKAILEEVNLQPLVLEDLPCGSKTIVEKLEMYSDVDFAFVILTPDDEGCVCGVINQILELKDKEKRFQHALAKNTLIFRNPDVEKLTREIHNRARQNAILEFGYFIGKIGRKKVCYLLKKTVEIPSDMNGIAYIQFTESIKEVKQKILNELIEAEVI